MFLRTTREMQDVKGNSKTKHKKQHLIIYTHIIQQLLIVLGSEQYKGIGISYRDFTVDLEA